MDECEGVNISMFNQTFISNDDRKEDEISLFYMGAKGRRSITFFYQNICNVVLCLRFYITESQV
jgi:hypothetical protein